MSLLGALLHFYTVQRALTRECVNQDIFPLVVSLVT